MMTVNAGTYPTPRAQKVDEMLFTPGQRCACTYDCGGLPENAVCIYSGAWTDDLVEQLNEIDFRQNGETMPFCVGEKFHHWEYSTTHGFEFIRDTRFLWTRDPNKMPSPARIGFTHYWKGFYLMGPEDGYFFPSVYLFILFYHANSCNTPYHNVNRELGIPWNSYETLNLSYQETYRNYFPRYFNGAHDPYSYYVLQWPVHPVTGRVMGLEISTPSNGLSDCVIYTAVLQCAADIFPYRGGDLKISRSDVDVVDPAEYMRNCGDGGVTDHGPVAGLLDNITGEPCDIGILAFIRLNSPTTPSFVDLSNFEAWDSSRDEVNQIHVYGGSIKGADFCGYGIVNFKNDGSPCFLTNNKILELSEINGEGENEIISSSFHACYDYSFGGRIVSAKYIPLAIQGAENHIQYIDTTDKYCECSFVADITMNRIVEIINIGSHAFGGNVVIRTHLINHRLNLVYNHIAEYILKNYDKVYKNYYYNSSDYVVDIRHCYFSSNGDNRYAEDSGANIVDFSGTIPNVVNASYKLRIYINEFFSESNAREVFTKIENGEIQTFADSYNGTAFTIGGFEV